MTVRAVHIVPLHDTVTRRLLDWPKGIVVMRSLFIAALAASSLFSSKGHAETSARDRDYANEALLELHKLASASAKSSQAAKDGDYVGCRLANTSMEEAAHNALEDMHYMSFAPFDAIQSVANFLRLERLDQSSRCSIDPNMDLKLLTAGQAILELRWDYAIGEDNWFTADAGSGINGRNPLMYSQSLWDLNYSWVDIRPPHMWLVAIRDWKSEMASGRIDDPSIENSGKNMQVVEVEYRKKSDDKIVEGYYYRFREGAVAAALQERKQAAEDAKLDAAKRAGELDWIQKLASLPFIVANSDIGFKLIYAVCKPTARDLKEVATCHSDDSYDWSDDIHTPYRWFSSLDECNEVSYRINKMHPSNVQVDTGDFFMPDCVPAPQIAGRALRGYQMIVAISSPNSGYGQVSYVYSRTSGSKTAALFSTFDLCRRDINNMYANIERDLNVDADGIFLKDKSKSISVTADCVRAY